MVGVCQIRSGKYKGKFVVVYKDKPRLKGVALPGGTAGNSSDNAREVYEQTLIREFKEECGISLSTMRPIMVANPCARLVHSCVVYICKGDITTNQRDEDKDLGIKYVSWKQLKKLLSSTNSIDPWIMPYINENEKELKEYFNLGFSLF